MPACLQKRSLRNCLPETRRDSPNFTSRARETQDAHLRDEDEDASPSNASNDITPVIPVMQPRARGNYGADDSE